MDKRIAFDSFNPVTNFVFFIIAIVLGMIFNHPLFLIASIVGAVLFLLTVDVRSTLKLLLTLLPIFVLIVIINPIFNTRGETILFYLFNRPFTFEALIYGGVFAGLFLVISLWFYAYSKLITSDKFIYIFGPLAPALSLVLTMVLRFVPSYGRKAKQIVTARKAIGKGDKRDAPSVIGALTTWAFENGITASDSMRSRGYGTGKRSSFKLYKFTCRDILLIVVDLLLLSIVIFSSIKGGTTCSFVPTIIFSINIYTIIGIIAYSLLLLIPTIINLKEVLLWQILRSKI